MTEKLNWYVMYTAPRAEKKVAERLKEKGTEVYLPMIEEIRQWSDRKKKFKNLYSTVMFLFIQAKKGYGNLYKLREL